MLRPDMELGNYRLLERLGAGGMGEVWRAEDTRLLRKVAIKILPPQLANDEEWKERFLREARTIAQLNHPNIATIYSIAEDGEFFFIAMELVEGEPLSNVIARGPVPAGDAVRIAAAVADGLAEAHEKGIIHRDIKPDNILVSKKVVKVLDFGIAKQIGGTADPGLTMGGMVMGTPHYMSPEQALGRDFDPRTDIFSLGVVLYEMLSGHRPFTGDVATQVLLQIVMTEPRDIATAVPDITPQLAAVVKRAMAKQAADRFRSSDEMRKALADTLRDDPSRLRRSSSAPGLNPPRPKSNPRSEAAPRSDAKPRADAPPRSPTFRPATGSPRSVAPTPKPQRAASEAGGGPRALIADDDPATRYLLGSVLTKYQIAFDEASNGADAVKLLKVNDYTVVFIDLLMPRIDGWGVIDFIRNHKRGQKPRTFIVTGVLDQKLSTADQDVVTGLLYKPIDIAQVEKVVAG